MTDKTLKTHVKTCGDLKAEIDRLTALFNAEKETITTALKSRETQDFTASGYNVKYSEFTQNRLDSAALRKNYPAIAEEYTREIPATRFTVKAV